MERNIDIYANKLGDEKLGMWTSLAPTRIVDQFLH
jgi:hypothetical protein